MLGLRRSRRSHTPIRKSCLWKPVSLLPDAPATSHENMILPSDPNEIHWNGLQHPFQPLSTDQHPTHKQHVRQPGSISVPGLHQPRIRKRTRKSFVSLETRHALAPTHLSRVPSLQRISTNALRDVRVRPGPLDDRRTHRPWLGEVVHDDRQDRRVLGPRQRDVEVVQQDGDVKRILRPRGAFQDIQKAGRRNRARGGVVLVTREKGTSCGVSHEHDLSVSCQGLARSKLSP